MAKDCNMARDLMPLVIDGAASNESAAFVEKHMQDCPPCRTYFDGMKKDFKTTAAEKQQQEEEKKMMATAALALKKRRKRRALKAVLIGVTVALILTYCGVLLFTHLAYTPAVPLKAEQMQVSLYQLSNGDVYMRQTVLNAGFYIGWHESTEIVEGKKVLSLQAIEPRLTFRRQETGSSCTGILSDIQDYDLIRAGKEGDWNIIWEKGKEIPAASEALENYWAVSAKIDALFEQAQDVDGKPLFTDAQRIEYEKLRAELSFWSRQLFEERNAEPEGAIQD